MSPFPERQPDHDRAAVGEVPPDGRLRAARLLFALGLLALAAGAIHLALGAKWPALAVYGGAAVVLLLCALALRLAAGRRQTVLRRRTVEDVERQVEELETQNRKIRAAYRDVTTALREQQARLADAEAGQHILAVGAEPTGASDLHERILHLLMEHLGAEGAALWLLEEKGERLEARAWSGQVAPILRDDPVKVTPERQPSDLRHACEARLRAASPTPPPLPAEGEGEGPGERADGPDILGAFLRDDDRPVGVVALSGARSGRFTDGDSERLQRFAPLIGRAVRSVEERARLRRSVREAAALGEMARLLQSAVPAPEMYEAVVDLVGRFVECENCTVFRYDPREKRLIPMATRGRVVNLMDHIPFEQGTGVSGWAAQERKQVFIADLAREPGLLNVELIPPRVRCFLAVPMMARERVAGVLNVSHAQPHAFTPEDLRVLALLAGQAALALEERRGTAAQGGTP